MWKNINLTTALAACLLFFNIPAIADTTNKSHTTLNEVYAERSYQRAKEAALWSQSILGVAMTLDAIHKLGGDYNDIAYLSNPQTGNGVF